MTICGIKLTHDGAIALIDGNHLVFCIEMEKLNNQLRFSPLSNWQKVSQILADHGYAMEDIDQFVLDGWGAIGQSEVKPFQMTIPDRSGTATFELAGYGAMVINQDLLKPSSFAAVGGNFTYKSYMHAAGHFAGAYCTSPFAAKNEDSFVLIWDGGMCPQLFYYHEAERRVENLRPLFLLNGHIYSLFANQFPPFDTYAPDDMSIAGKVMAYIATGKPDRLLGHVFHCLYKTLSPADEANSVTLVQRLVDYGRTHGYTPETMMATFHVFLEELLIESLRTAVEQRPGYIRNLCFVGGCALNIKWNSAIRCAGIFSDMWVPPFPNDSGSALGTACCEYIHQGGSALDWNVYSGPELRDRGTITGWEEKSCSIEDLADLLYRTGEPVVFLQGRAELGPRALGNRSILASPLNPSAKDVLNRVKKREDYRPVAPICIAEAAPAYFTPGSPDPYMLYDHLVREEWKEKLAAICHLDGTARLQTVDQDSNAAIYALLKAFGERSGVPVLCNTSANHNGRGFFPDAAAAMEWNKVNFIWSNGRLFYKHGWKELHPDDRIAAIQPDEQAGEKAFEIIHF